jgi:3-oxochol-4-en-24-oyl-CoA dehydrogenase
LLVSIGITEEHRALADSAAGTLARHGGIAIARAIADGNSPADLGQAQQAIAAQGLLGLHVGGEHGGSGYGVVELAVVAEQAGRALAPGAIVPTLLATAILQADGGPMAKSHLPGLVGGTASAAVGIGASALQLADGRAVGTVAPVIGGADADVLVLPAVLDGTTRWLVVTGQDVTVEQVASLDPSRPVGRVVVDLQDAGDRLLTIDDDVVRSIATVVLGAEATGLAGWALDTSVAYAKVREQFGRPIGQFQGVKHRCAELLVQVEESRAAVWDAARALDEVSDGIDPALPVAVAAAVAIEAGHHVTEECIQLLGGIGFTWEHDAHLYLRRATATRALLGTAAAHQRHVADLVLAGHRRDLHLDLDAHATAEIRDRVQQFVASLDGLSDDEQRAALTASGYQVPHWPPPWGLDASPVEQLVIDEELAAGGVSRPNLAIGGWILPTLIGYGTPEQQERFIGPTLRGELTWCQLFSEPGAGSDLAAIQSRAVRVEGGWEITGQKVWTSLAHRSDYGLLIARTDPNAPRHDGITAFVLPMDARGVDIRPLKEMTGNELFNEVYLDQVFIPDDLVVGPINGGWKAARNTLANERVAMSSGSAMGSGVENVIDALAGTPAVDDPGIRQRLGALVAEGQVLGLLGFRTTLAQLSGVEPGASSSVRKLVGGHHARDCSELVLEALGPAGIMAEGAAAGASYMYLQTQCLTIAGGTTNVQLNVIAERLLGLPRDP